MDSTERAQLVKDLTEARAEVARLLGELHDMTKRALAAERDCPTRHAAGFREGVEAAAKLADAKFNRLLRSENLADAIRARAPPAPAAAREAHPLHPGPGPEPPPQETISRQDYD